MAGTDQPVRRGPPEPKAQPVTDIRHPPAWMTNEDALAEWRRLVPMLLAMRVLTEPDLTMLAALCQQWGIILRKIRKNEDPTAAEWSQYRMYCSEFAVTPASRTRVQAAADGKPQNRFSAHVRPTA